MPTTQIRGSTQIMSGTIPWDRMASGAIVPTASLVDGAEFLRRGGTVALTANLPAGGFLITGLGDGVADQDVVNIRTARAMMQGIGLIVRVRGVVTANNALTGALTANGVTYVTGDVALLTAQTAPAQNGPWVINTAGAWTRPTFWAAASTQKAALFYVTEGTGFADTKWTTLTDGNITVDTTSVSITQDTTGATYSAGNGLSLTGSVFAAKMGNGVQFDGSFNITAKPYATRLITVDANGIGVTDGTPAQMVIANASGNAAWAAMSGDVTISNSGVTTVNHAAGTGFLKYGDIAYNETPGGTVNGSNTAFTLATAPLNSSLKLYNNGGLLEPGAGNDYTISAAAITMLFAPLTGDKLRAYYVK